MGSAGAAVLEILRNASAPVGVLTRALPTLRPGRRKAFIMCWGAFPSLRRESPGPLPPSHTCRRQLSWSRNSYDRQSGKSWKGDLPTQRDRLDIEISPGLLSGIGLRPQGLVSRAPGVI